MGKRGPKPRNPARKAKPKIGRRVVLHRPVSDSEVSFARFKPPARLSERGRKIWREIGKMLARAGALREGHARLLWLLCGTLERLEDTRDYIEKHQQQGGAKRIAACVFKTKNGYPVLAPWFQAEMRLNEFAAKLLGQFGMAPSEDEIPVEQHDAMRIIGGWQQYASKVTVMGAGRSSGSAGLPV